MVRENKVDIQKGSVTGNVYGGYANDSGSANENTVNIKSVAGTIYGGYASGSGSASDNKVNILGDFAGGSTNIYGGYSSAGDAFHNTVGISGVKNLTLGNIFGGNGSSRTGNTLVTDGTTPGFDTIKAASIQNFENYRFTLSEVNKNANFVYTLSKSVNLTGAKLEFSLNPGDELLIPGDRFILFSEAKGTPTAAGKQIQHGVSLVYNVVPGPIDGGYGLTVEGISGSASFTRAISQVQLSGLVIGQLTANFLLDSGIPAALDAFNAIDALAQNPLASGRAHASPASRSESCLPFSLGGGFAVFAAVDGGFSEYKTGYGSELDVDHLSFLTGLGWRGDTGTGKLFLGAAIHGGIGRYDSEFDGRTYANNDNFHNIGGGLLARFDHASGFYGEAEGHLGRSLVKFDAVDPASVNPAWVSFKSRNTYYGLGAGLGWLGRLGSIKLDASLRYAWSGSNGQNLVLLGDPFRLGGVHSHRLRAGGRVYFPAGPVSPYAGAYFEYEFNGKSLGNTYGYALREAKLKGVTGQGEAGVRYAAGRFHADLGLKGYVGKRRGLSLNLGVGYSF
ncbi:MAG: hypothetical protein LBU64_04950 [Planctomycetota bacterium]|nr:hypothetical protein [Planctomycetota bacterium]